MTEAQQWLKYNYENEKNNTKEIKIKKGTKLEGKLTIDGYSNLEGIYLGNAERITELIFINCPKVETIFVSNNQITKIEGLAELTNLQNLSFNNNRIEEIDISRNGQLKFLYFAENPTNLKFVNGIRNLPTVFWNSENTFPIAKLLEQVSEVDLKEVAEKLGLNVDGKTPEQMKNIIKGEADKIEENKVKINQELPGLLNQTAAVNDEKLEEIKNNVSKGEEYQRLVTEPINAPIVEAGKIDQVKLTNELKKAAGYGELVKNNDDLTDDVKEIKQEKIEVLKNANKESVDAIARLGVNNLKVPTLESKLGEGTNLGDIPTTLRDLLERVKKLEDALNSVGINLGGDMKKEIAMLAGLRERAKELFGQNYEEILKVEEYQSQVEINTNWEN